jgi:hypothetical protein
VLKNHCQVRRHRMLIFPPRPAPGNLAVTGAAWRYGPQPSLMASTTTLL